MDTLVTLLQHAEGMRDTAQLSLQRIEAAAESARKQAQQLLTYRSEYEQRWAREFAQRSNMEIVRHYQGFMQRLTQAVEQQEHVVAHCTAQLESARDMLRSQELRVASLRKLIERRAKELQATALRHERRDADELAALAAWSRESRFDSALASSH
jgi:flagellar FliJ protein